MNQWRVTLAEPIGQAGDLLDLQADPGSVFLYRREPRALAEKLGVNCSKFEGPTVPVVYNVSFKDPAGFAANADSVEIDKLLAFVDNVLLTANGVAALGVNIETWRIDSHIR